MKKNISINLQGIIFHVEDDGYEVLSRYLQEVKAHFASYQGHEEIVADIEGRIAELFAARISPAKQVITLADVQEMTAKMGRVSDFNTSPDEDEEEPAYAGTGQQSAGFGRPASGRTPPPAGGFATHDADGQPRRLYRDLAHRKIAGVCAGLAQYFMVNPLVVRLVFLAALLLPNLFINVGHWGFGDWRGHFGLGQVAFWSYVVLWIALPKRYDAPEPIDTLSNSGPLAGRKFYRDTDAGKVGGVSAGLAAYFNVDVTLIRVLFLATTLVGGTGFVVYIILWIVVPEARTVSEKMQMRGDAVTLSGIDSNLRSNATDGPAGPNRPVGTFFENAAREARPALGFVGGALRVVVGASLLLLAGFLLIWLALSFGVILGLLPHDTMDLGEPGTKYLLLHDVPTWGIVSAFLALGVPSLALLLLGLRLLLRRSVLNQTGSLLLLGLWLAGLAGTAAATAQYARNYQTHASYTTTQELDYIPSPGLVLDARDHSEYLRQVRLRLAPADSNAAVRVEQEFSARGRSQSAARLTAQNSISYNYSQQDSTLTFDRGIELKENMPFRNQQLTLTLHLPLGKVYTLTPAFLELLDDDDFTDRHRPDTDEPYRARLTRQGRFTCLGCSSSSDASSNDEGDDENSDGDEVVKFDVNGNRMRVRVNTDGDQPRVSVETDAASFNTEPGHYGSERKTLSDPGEFSEIEAGGALHVVVRAGNEYKVEAAGRPADLRELRLRRDGNRVILGQSSGDFDLFSLGSHSSHEILVTVTLPRLRELILNGACQADVSGFTQSEDLHLEARGASAVRLAAEVPTLTLELRGASRADLTGHAQRLDLEGHGASQVEALGLSANQVKANLHEASQASVRATETLDVDLSSGSQMKYAGDPRIEQNLSSGSSLEQVRD
ncbi:PspC domain-containing protein [Hymenobacter sp. RP-2-7]|uniref:PspC domain-containing protein n=1 Tax=Hymenobacter polaris TaxID=2682546 RepID=A0A7Y0FM13_9BACT|nr:PspC domain-containing protein [Hymenobacter polaris]NML65382.1 PspC domain-containing protein [Hymenobacter polaris]